MYKIVITLKAKKQLAQVPRKEADKLAEKINGLAENPIPHGSKKLAGYENLYRIRQGDYRVMYAIEDAILVVTVIKIGHRKDIYE